MPRPDAANRVDVSRMGLGHVLRALRGHVGWSQADLAQASGISAAMVAKLEQGNRGPSRNALAQVAAPFGLGGDDVEDVANRLDDVAAERRELQRSSSPCSSASLWPVVRDRSPVRGDGGGAGRVRRRRDWRRRP